MPKATVLSQIGRTCLLGEEKQRQIERTDMQDMGRCIDGSPIPSLPLKETGISIAVFQDTQLWLLHTRANT